MSESGVISGASGVDACIWQAVIAGVFLAAGWLVNGWHNRRAHYSETDANLASLWDPVCWQRYRGRIVGKMEDDADFVPFIPTERHDPVFDAVIADVRVLPRQTIDPSVLHYAQVKSVAADICARGFATFAQGRRIAMKVQLLAFGSYANALINGYSKEGADAVRTEAQRLNSLARAPSCRSGD